MSKKRNSIGQTLSVGVAAMILFSMLSCAITAVFISNEMMPEKTGSVICWCINILGAYAVSWYTAKRSEKNKMQMAAAVIGLYGCICAFTGMVIFPKQELQLSVWMLILLGAAALGGITSCMKKERKR